MNRNSPWQRTYSVKVYALSNYFDNAIGQQTLLQCTQHIRRLVPPLGKLNQTQRRPTDSAPSALFRENVTSFTKAEVHNR